MAANRVLRVSHVDDGVAAHTLREGIAKIQADLDVTPEFTTDVEEAAAAAAAQPRLPDLDRTDIPFVTIDPASAMDLDQALHIERDADGYVVRYAIADVAAFITPGDPIDKEAHARGETLYGADSKVPLHPPVLSEDAASLLPYHVRPALLWTIKVDAEGEGTDVFVERARVKSVAKLDYHTAQKMIDADDDSEAYSESLRLLKVVGLLRIAKEIDRGGVNLPLPDQGIDVESDHWRLEFRDKLPVEDWNAQISLLTGFGAADLMVYARVGVLRTLPPPDPRDVKRLHRTAAALGIEWPAEMLYPDFIRSLDPSDAVQGAMIVACTRLLRGSGYATFNGELPELSEHAALASEYAHVTAPLRRLADRYAGEICLALCADEPVPDWVVAELPTLPDTMRESGRRSAQYEANVVNLVEAGVLADRVGETFDAVVTEVSEKDPTRGAISIQDPAIEASVTGERELPLGEQISVVLAAAEIVGRQVSFRTA